LCFLFVCLCPVSGVPNVDSISVLCFCLFVFILCLVYPMLTVFMCCVFCLFVFFLCLVYPMLTVSTKANKQKTQHRDTVNIGYTRHRTETNKQKYNTEILSTLGTPETANVDSISVLCFCLFVSVLCLVYPMLTVSLCCVFVCLSLSCFWCTQC
jgi:hypothetical protein